MARARRGAGGAGRAAGADGDVGGRAIVRAATPADGPRRVRAGRRWRRGSARRSSRARRPRAPPPWSAWLRAFGPGTELDLKWWLGSTLTAVRRALADVGRSPSISTARPATCCPTTWTRRPGGAVGRAAAGARSDHDGLERARLVPRPAQGPGVRLATATPGRPSGATAGSSAAGGSARPARSSVQLLEDVGRGATRHRRRGGPAHRVAGRRPGAAALPVTAVEAARSYRAVDPTATQSRSGQGATSTSLPSASARVHHSGAFSSLTTWPPAASAAATRASAWSCGT